MNRVMLLYPPGKLYQRGEDRAQTNIEDSTAGSVHACNDLGYVAAILRENGYELFLRDYQTERKTLADARADLLRFQPDLVFISVTNATIYGDLAFIRQLKASRDFRVVLKGAIFFDVKLERLRDLDLADVDCAVGGEVEFSILQIADWLLRGEGDPQRIPGIVYPTPDGFRKTSFCGFNTDLDSLPFPARDLMNNALYVRPDTGEPMATVSVARGCPSRCIYCLTPAITGRELRFRSIENVYAEIEECFVKYGIRNFFFKADTFTINKDWAIRLCDRILTSPLKGKIGFTANARADTVSPALLRKMKAAGCFMIAIGFESGSDESLRRMKKGVTVRQNLEAAAMVKAAGIPLFGFFIIGFPWETKADMKRTVSHMLRLAPDFAELHVAMPFYGTELYELCREADTLTDHAFGFDYFIPNTRGTATVPLREIQKIKERGILRFYMRPSFLFGKAVDVVRRPVVLKNYFRYGVKLLKHLRVRT